MNNSPNSVLEIIKIYLDEQYEADKIAKCPYDHEKSKLPCGCGYKKV